MNTFKTEIRRKIPANFFEFLTNARKTQYFRNFYESLPSLPSFQVNF